MPVKRIFVAVDIPEDVRERVARMIGLLKSRFQDAPVRWERAEKLHVTLKFAGDLDEDQLGVLEQTTAAAAARSRPFNAAVHRPGAFVKKRGGVLWLAVSSQPENAMSELAGLVDRDARRNFTPHLTIARIKNRKETADLVEYFKQTTFEPLDFTVDELVVFESKLLPSGSEYSVISRHPLGP